MSALSRRNLLTWTAALGGSVAVASHSPFEQWGRFLPEHVTATSLLDRLLHHATVVVTEVESFRMREARTRTARSRS